MDPRHLFADERLSGRCAYCGGAPSCKDHVPSRVLLDEPYPDNMPVVEACRDCNEGFSRDEEYVACIVECARTGSTEPSERMRPKIARILAAKPELRSMLASTAARNLFGEVEWSVDVSRVGNVALKLARGHCYYELSEGQLGRPTSWGFAPIVTLTAEQRQDFEGTNVNQVAPWPEIGSRAFLRAAGALSAFSAPSGWLVAQPARYRYLLTLDSGIRVRFVLSEYLAAEILWEN